VANEIARLICCGIDVFLKIDLLLNSLNERPTLIDIGSIIFTFILKRNVYELQFLWNRRFISSGIYQTVTTVLLSIAYQLHRSSKE